MEYDIAYQTFQFYQLRDTDLKRIISTLLERYFDTTDKSGEIEAMHFHYNYCREHSQLGKTPADIAGIKIDDENKWMTVNRTQANYRIN